MSRVPRLAPTLRIVQRLALSIAGIFIIHAGGVAFGSDWSTPEQQLARKIVAATGNGSIAVVVENRSSLGRREGEVIQNGLRSALTSMGAKLVGADVASTPVRISLSENLPRTLGGADFGEWERRNGRNGFDTASGRRCRSA